MFLPLFGGICDHSASECLHAAADVGGGFGDDLLPLQYGFKVGQCLGLLMGGGGVAVDADFLGGGGAPANVEDAVANRADVAGAGEVIDHRDAEMIWKLRQSAYYLAKEQPDHLTAKQHYAKRLRCLTTGQIPIKDGRGRKRKV